MASLHQMTSGQLPGGREGSSRAQVQLWPYLWAAAYLAPGGDCQGLGHPPSSSLRAPQVQAVYLAELSLGCPVPQVGLWQWETRGPGDQDGSSGSESSPQPRVAYLSSCACYMAQGTPP